MNITEQYLEALKIVDDWILVSDWAVKVGELYPELLSKANLEAENQQRETTGVREIAARISSAIVRGSYLNDIEIDETERPRKVRYVSQTEHEAHVQKEIDDDVAPLKRGEIIKQAEKTQTAAEAYRIAELETISKHLRKFFQLDFEVDHAQALLNADQAGEHHPDNLQLLLKAHNGKKTNNNWQRFSLQEQIDYIQAAINLQGLIAPRLNIECDDSVIEGLLERIKKVY